MRTTPLQPRLLPSLLFGLLCGGFLFFFTADAAVYQVYPSDSNWQSILGGLKAGDTAHVHTGTYSYSNGWSMTLNGRQGAPITITGLLNETRPKFVQTNGNNQNNLGVQGSWFSLTWLDFSGGNEGVRLGTPNAALSYVNLTSLVVHDTQSTAITANFPGMTATWVRLVNNEVHSTGSGTGECFYLGCVESSPCTFAHGTVSNNYCHNTTYAQGGSQGSGIQIKSGSYSNLIQDNVCVNLGGPCVLVYDDYDLGRNQIIGNLVINTKDNGIQATAGADIINNIIIQATAWGIAISNPSDLKSGKTFRNISILHNTVVNVTGSGGGGLKLTGLSPTTNWVIANNAVFTPTGTAISVSSYGGSQSDFTNARAYNNVWLGGSPPANAPAGALIAASSEFQDMQNPTATALVMYPTTNGQLPKAGNPSNSYAKDYNGTPRSTTAPTIGAYEYTTPTNPGKPLKAGFKGS